MKTLRNATIAGVAGFAMIAAASLVAPSQAHANNFGAALLGFGVATAVIAATSHPVYAAPVYAAPVRTCTYQNRFVGYNAYGQAVYQRVTVC